MSATDVTVMACTRCSVERPLAAFAARHRKCRDCCNELRRASRDYASESEAKRRGERARAKQHKAAYLRRAAKARETLSDGYIRSMLYRELKASDVPQSFVELKRAQLLLKRELWKGRDDGRE